MTLVSFIYSEAWQETGEGENGERRLANGRRPGAKLATAAGGPQPSCTRCLLKPLAYDPVCIIINNTPYYNTHLNFFF